VTGPRPGETDEGGPPEIRTETLRVNGLRTICRRAGAGPPLVLLHHAGGSSRRWRRVLPALARDWSVYAPDLPGHGESEVPGGSAWQAWQDFLPGLLEAAGLVPDPPPAVVAHSLSGLALTACLHETPLDLAALVLVAPPTGRRDLPSPIRISRPGVAARAASWKGFQDAARARMAGDPSRIGEEDWRAVHDDFILPSAQKTLHSLLPEYSSLEDLPAPVRPMPQTLLLWGERDRLVPVDSLDRWLAALPGARRRVLPGLGHLPMLEDPEGFVAAVQDHLAS